MNEDQIHNHVSINKTTTKKLSGKTIKPGSRIQLLIVNAVNRGGIVKAIFRATSSSAHLLSIINVCRYKRYLLRFVASLLVALFHIHSMADSITY